MTNCVDPDQTTPWWAVWSGSTLFAQTCLPENIGSLQYIVYSTAAAHTNHLKFTEVLCHIRIFFTSAQNSEFYQVSSPKWWNFWSAQTSFSCIPFHQYFKLKSCGISSIWYLDFQLSNWRVSSFFGVGQRGNDVKPDIKRCSKSHRNWCKRLILHFPM